MARRLTKKQKRRRIQVILALVIFALGVLFGIFISDNGLYFSHLPQYIDQMNRSFKSGLPKNFQYHDTAKIHVLDVGQGSATLLEGRDGTTILIDSGRYDDGEKRILTYLDEFIGTGAVIDLAIFTHMDADHIGHADLVFEYHPIKEVWVNGADHTTETYFDLMEAIESSRAEYLEPKMGYQKQIGDAHIEVFWPIIQEDYEDQNESSIIGRITFPEFSFVFSGDASYHIEDQVLAHGYDVSADFLLVGHHGAHDSTGWNWLGAVQPKLAFYQAGAENPYGHPHSEPLYRLSQKRIPVYGTDEYGTISIFVEEEGIYHLETTYELDEAA